MNFVKTTFSFFCLFFFASTQANVTTYFNHIKTDPKALYAFFKVMPKGGELHYHLAGGAYPEAMLSVAAQDNYCLNKESFAISKKTHCEGIKSADLNKYPQIYSKTIESWSMEHFVPGQESAHDHFFNGFEKYMPIVFDYRPALLADIIQRAAAQHELYLEILDIPDNAQSASFGHLIQNIPSYAQKRELLLANKGFQHNISYTAEKSDKIIAQTREYLGCSSNPSAEFCTVKVKFLYYSLREQSLDNLFAQTLNAFEAVSRSKGSLVGVNLVQPENGSISLRDFHKQMQVFEFFHHMYPHVKISLHAGELSPETVSSEGLKNHIQEAIFIGHAERIGHGADITFEDNSLDTVRYMAKNRLPVEINLISNKVILNLYGSGHPLNYYLSHHVPVVLSTDDEGVLRTDLTHQYVEAVRAHDIGYEELKQISRNTLTYAFLPGKSIWANADKATLVPQCHDLGSSNCKRFIQNNQKAALQWDLEQKLIAFEKTYN